jgi:hypothetical protein
MMEVQLLKQKVLPKADMEMQMEVNQQVLLVLRETPHSEVSQDLLISKLCVE